MMNCFVLYVCVYVCMTYVCTYVYIFIYLYNVCLYVCIALTYVVPINSWKSCTKSTEYLRDPLADSASEIRDHTRPKYSIIIVPCKGSVYLQQELSSDESLQSVSPSHCTLCGTHDRGFPQMNSDELHDPTCKTIAL